MRFYQVIVRATYEAACVFFQRNLSVSDTISTIHSTNEYIKADNEDKAKKLAVKQVQNTYLEKSREFSPETLFHTFWDVAIKRRQKIKVNSVSQKDIEAVYIRELKAAEVLNHFPINDIAEVLLA